MSVDFGQNVDDKIGITTLRTIGSQRPQITRTRLSNCDVFDLVISGLPWHNTMRSESKNLVEKLRGNNIFNSYERKNNFQLEKLGAKVL